MSRHLRLTLAAAVAAALCTAAVPACAADRTADTGSVLVGVGPLGLGLGYGVRLGEHWSGRAVLNSGSLARVKANDVREGANRWDVEGRIGAGVSLLADYAPWADSGWRLTTGLVVARFSPTLTGRPDGAGNYSLGGHRWSATQVGTLKADVRTGSVFGYLGAGWDSKPVGTPGWHFVSDVGLLVGSRSRATLTAGNAAGNAALQQDLATEQRALERRALGLMAQVGVAFTF